MVTLFFLYLSVRKKPAEMINDRPASVDAVNWIKSQTAAVIVDSSCILSSFFPFCSGLVSNNVALLA